MLGIGSNELLIIIIPILLFILCREFMTWYWKQNKIVKLLTENRNFQEEISQHLKTIVVNIEQSTKFSRLAIPPKTNAQNKNERSGVNNGKVKKIET